MLVTLDTLRADHLGVYGGDVQTPHLDALAAGGAWVAEASTHVPLTRPAHVAMMSGLLPHRTGIRDNISPVPIPQVPLLAEVLAGAGFRTAAFVSAAVVGRASGLDRGFEVFGDDLDGDLDGDFDHALNDATGPVFLGQAQRRGDRTLAEATAWLEAHRDEPRLFLWLHLYDPHDPYEAPEPWGSRYPDRPYAGEVAWTDELIGRWRASLDRLGLGEETLMVVTSDHGEGLGEHDEQLHGFFAYQSTLRVPLIFHGPGIEVGGRLAGPVGLVDLFPTVLDLLDVPGSADPLSGRSLAAALRGEGTVAVEPVYAESLIARLHFGWSDLRTLRNGRWKYIRAPRPELYDLEADPGERDNLATRDRGRLREMRDLLTGFLAEEVETREMGIVSSEWLQQMAALGYVGGAAPATTATPGADPKDKIAEFRRANDLMRQGLEHLQRGEPAASAAQFEKLLGQGIDTGEIHLYLGRARLDAGRLAEAAVSFLEATARVPAHAEGWLGLAEARVRLGDLPEALAALRASHEPLPDHAGLRREEGRLLLRLGRRQEARGVLEEALALGPADPWVYRTLGEVVRDSGEPAAAVPLLERAIELAPDDAAAWNALGMTLGGLGKMSEAEVAFRNAIRLDAEHHLYVYNLGLALVRAGNGDAAREYFARSVELEPSFQPARDRLSELAGRLGTYTNH